MVISVQNPQMFLVRQDAAMGTSWSGNARAVIGGCRRIAISRQRSANSCCNASHDPWLVPASLGGGPARWVSLPMTPPSVELFASSSAARAGGATAVEALVRFALGVFGAAAASIAEALGLALFCGAMLELGVCASQLSCRSPRTAPTIIAKRTRQ